MKTLIIPGWQDSGPRHWQSLFEAAIRESERVVQRDWNTPQLADWVATLDGYIRGSGDRAMLVAHSLGCIAVAHWAAQAERSQLEKVAAAMLVAPAAIDRPDCTPELRNFAPIPMKPLPFRSVLVASDTDPYCPIERAKEFADAWRSEFRNIGDAGHINADAGFGSWPEGIRILRDLAADAHSNRTADAVSGAAYRERS